jgi:hypothetical protein
VGIGTNTPTGQFEVTGGSGSTGVQSYFSAQTGWGNPSAGNAAMSIGAKLVLWHNTTTPQKLSMGIDSNADMWFNNAGAQSGAGFTFYTGNGASATPTARLTIAKNGNVGIGTTNVGSATALLSVNGTIRAQEVIVEASPWPDYVFAPDYNLPTLTEVAEHIEANGHLPGVPSAATVGQQGVGVGEMQATLLRKVEELTLYIIAQEKRSAEQEQRAAAQAAEIQSLRATLEALQTRTAQPAAQ